MTMFMQNRELSWLRFNERVLEEASDVDTPLLERLKFLSIFVSNLDEFFMVRCGSLYDLSLVQMSHIDRRTGMNPSEELDAIYDAVAELYPKKDQIELKINHELESLNMSCLTKKKLTKTQYKWLEQYFESDIAPHLSAFIIDWQHPMPNLSNKAQYVFVHLTKKDQTNFGIVPIPEYMSRIIYIPGAEGNYVLLEQLVYWMADRIFKSKHILCKTIIRLTRNADINLNGNQMDENEDYLTFMKKVLKKRQRLAPIRLEYYKHIDEDMKSYLIYQLNIQEKQVFESRTTMELNYVFDLIAQAPKSISEGALYQQYSIKPCPDLNVNQDIIPQVLQRDYVLFYPYEDVDIFLRLLREASRSRKVVSIKITIYRLARDSQVVQALQEASENGIDVTVLIEIRARFDEQNNIEAAQQLKKAGCTVIYGFEKYKVHSKVLQIEFKSRSGLKAITQIGTGNYNENTCRQYTDICYMTAREDIANDARSFFQNLYLSNVNARYSKLWVSPYCLKLNVLSAIDEQIQRAKRGQEAYIGLKMNSMTDIAIMKKLQEASQAGVQIQMIIRGICCLLPGIEGQTQNIEVHSIVGRFLEHSRIYIFGPKKACNLYISSADFMTRNTERRVEVACPIYDVDSKNRIITYFEDQWRDNVKTRVMQKDGTYAKVKASNQLYNYQDAYLRKVIEKPKKHFLSWLFRLFKR